ncbi:MAG: thiamine biosynthesis lipoprotein [Limisphaerales bacterium]|jgi:thiamine biosynthesis lipoprotein
MNSVANLHGKKTIYTEARRSHDPTVIHPIRKTRVFAALSAFIAVILLSGCVSAKREPELQLYEAIQPHMGTLVTISLYAPDKVAADNAATAAFARIAELNMILSDYEEESELRRLVREPVGMPVKISDDLMTVLSHSRDLSKKTDGAFDVTMGPIIRFWRRARRQRTLPDPARLAQVRSAVGYEKLKLDPRRGTATLLATNMFIDLGGIAKGYAADEALVTLRKLGILRALVAASGDIRAGDPPPGEKGWNVGIASIDAVNGELTDRTLLKNAAVSTSGDTEQNVLIDGVRYSHIVDPETGHGLRKRIGVTVVARDAMTTDSLATAISVLGAEKGLKLIESFPGTAAMIVEVTDEKTTRVTSRGYLELPRPK